MATLSALKLKLKKQMLGGDSGGNLRFTGAKPSQWGFMWEQWLEEAAHEKIPRLQNLWVLPSEDQALDFYRQLVSTKDNKSATLFLPGFGQSPYLSLAVDPSRVQRRHEVLAHLASGRDWSHLVCSWDTVYSYCPPRELFAEDTLNLEIGAILPPEKLVEHLQNSGYEATPFIARPGDFCAKGEIIDLYPTEGAPVRILYYDEMIEEMFQIEPTTQKSKRDHPVESLSLRASNLGLYRSERLQQIRERLPNPAASRKNQFRRRQNVLNRLQKGESVDEILFTATLLGDRSLLLHDYLDASRLCTHWLDADAGQKEFELFYEQMREEFDNAQNDEESNNIFPDPSWFIQTPSRIGERRGKANIWLYRYDISAGDSDSHSLALQELPLKTSKKFNLREKALSLMEKAVNERQDLFISCADPKEREQAHGFLSGFQWVQASEQNFHYLESSFETNFAHLGEKFCVIEARSLLTRTQRRRKTQPQSLENPDLFAEQMSTLKPGDFVMHRDHGIGVYQGMDNLEISGGALSDFLMIEYQEGDKIYVPVTRFHLIQKYADASAPHKAANLRLSKFHKAKERAKSSAKKLAVDLLQLQARRAQLQAYSFERPGEDDEAFANAFQFDETPDQLSAIDAIFEDMHRSVPMDRLICGDVGFGKTEVAMRAVYRAVLDHKQVAILVPTTLLALQHFQTFQKRFENTGATVEYISRLKGAKEGRETLEKLSEGKIDIIIGTHKLLSKEVHFADLGLVVVDEEHRFGVNHKEKLKSLKETVDFLSMTATPIPRTLQMAFLGLRELSLIQTPPPRRQAISTYVIREDETTLKSAIQKELDRGGQIYFVHNRVHDIEMIKEKILKLVPKASIIIGHGQLPERELEKRMKTFYAGECDILLATTIIESGIDIPNANTMIVYRADRFGLAQLHQLRGRIGRSDRKAYSYFVLPKDVRPSDLAAKRLRALQMYSDVGAGFHLASSDLEVRGAGDLLGADQSGHIESVGLELYLDLLKEAIEEVKGEKGKRATPVEISSFIPAFFPEDYIPNPSVRLKYYKKLSNTQTKERFQSVKEEVYDQFGSFPKEAQHLLDLLEIRFELETWGICSVSVSPTKLHIRFQKILLEKQVDWRNQLVETLLARPNMFQLKPDQTVVARSKNKLDENSLFSFIREVASLFPVPKTD